MLTHLDAVGNTTKAITKGIAIATAVLAATALFGSFRTTVRGRARQGRRHVQPVGRQAERAGRRDHRRGRGVHVLRPAISAVGRAAQRVVFEVRDQFRDHPGIMDYTEKPDYGRGGRHLHQGLAA